MKRIIFDGSSGKMIKVNDPIGPKTPHWNTNFVIQYKGMDWSGYRTLRNCQKQFPELEARNDGCIDFTVVEK